MARAGDVLDDPETGSRLVFLRTAAETGGTPRIRAHVRPRRLQRARPTSRETSGRGLWTLTPRDGGTDVRFDWRVSAEKPVVRALTPVLRPLIRWNHAWAIARARDGLEPYARRRVEPTAGSDAGGA